jgi:hypothetical protein
VYRNLGGKGSVTMDSRARDERSDLVHVAWAILVMGISIGAVIIVYSWFGHLGSVNSERVMERQQKDLRNQYGLPPEPVITNITILQTPPSLRNLSSGQNIVD